MLRGGGFAYETTGCRWLLLGAQTTLPKGAKEGLLGEGCRTTRQASWVFTLQTASSQRGESARKKNRERETRVERELAKAFILDRIQPVSPNKTPTICKISLCFTWQGQWLYFAPICCLRACGSLSSLVGLNACITVVSGALWNGGGDTAVKRILTLFLMAVLATRASRKSFLQL